MLERPLLSHHDGAAFHHRLFVAFVTFLFRQRFMVLGALCMLGAAGVVFGLFGRAVPVGTFFLTALSLAAGLGVAFVHFRHVALAVVAMAAPLPGMIAAGPFAASHGVGMLPLLAAYGFAVVTGVIWCAEVLRGLTAGKDRVQAALAIPARLVLPAAVAVLAAGLVLGGWLVRLAPGLALGVSVELLAGTLSSLLFVALGALALPFSEGAVTEINRAQERRALRLRLLTQVIAPRWGMSLAGAALVFVVLGYFGVEPLLAKGSILAKPAYWAGSALLVFLGGLAVGRGWRDALAVTLALTMQTLLGLWLWGIAVGHLTMLALVVAIMTGGVSLTLMLVMVDKARRYRMGGDAPDVARLKALEDCAVPAIYGCAGVAAAIAPWIVLHGSMATLAVLFVLASAASTIGAPAITTALETLVRRRFSVEELYGRG